VAGICTAVIDVFISKISTLHQRWTNKNTFQIDKAELTFCIQKNSDGISYLEQ
jgi:hypothetical protein